VVGVTQRLAPAFSKDTIMTKDQKVIRGKVGLLELAKQLGNVIQACKMMGYSRDSFNHRRFLISLNFVGRSARLASSSR
jgi:hypothetical protein